MDKEKQRQEISLIGRMLTIEVLLTLMGLVNFVYGLMNSESFNIFIGVAILGCLALLMHRRKSKRD